MNHAGGQPINLPAGLQLPLGLLRCRRNNWCVTRLLETLATELERPRKITAQVVNHLVGTYGITREDIGRFLTGELSRLEDYEIDLILSPLFTPGLKDQSVFAELLGDASVPPVEWPALVRQLVARPTQTTLVTEAAESLRVTLRDVTIERFVYRLRLDGIITAPMLELIQGLPATADRALLKAIARRAIWTKPARAEILSHWLNAARATAALNIDDAAALLKLAETYQPTNAKELSGSIPHWLQILRQEINEASNPKPFFNERVQDLHGGGRDQRRQNDSQVVAKEAEREFLLRLQRVLNS